MGRVNRYGWLGVGLTLALGCAHPAPPETKGAPSVRQGNATEPPPAPRIESPRAAEPSVAVASEAWLTNPCNPTPPIPVEPVPPLDSASCVLRLARGLVRNVRVALGDG